MDAGGLVSSGLDREVTEKLSARAKRFNLPANDIEYDEVVKLYDSFGISREEQKDPSSGVAKFRLEVVHVRVLGGSRLG